jgi:uncharacterized protein with HEPN domain
MRHDPLAAIIEAIERIEALMTGKTLDIYLDDWALRLAVERAIEIISEASRRIPPSLREQGPEIDWSKIFGIGNILRHDYHKIVDRVIFEVATERMRDLKIAVLAIAASLDGPEA